MSERASLYVLRVGVGLMLAILEAMSASPSDCRDQSPAWIFFHHMSFNCHSYIFTFFHLSLRTHSLSHDLMLVLQRLQSRLLV